ncbi:MAG TPA: NADP-dependent isocitrate dehydrogenase, partial [Solirubrobacteraceae bacterium]|nr:NADP-dependent isocitrate dehydrogenase [Solirubrobacteraceae bacterium]
EIELRDISLAGRILAQFGHTPDALAELGELARTPEANIIKLPNISASIPQLKAAIEELQAAGFDIPDYEDDPEPYDRVKGSAVNPVLREGNSDRRAPASVKAYARKHPHSMGAWSPDSKTHVATMSDGDFRHSERSVTMERDDTLRIELDGTVLRDGLEVLEGEIVDAAVMRRRALDAFLEEQVADAKAQGVLFSLHMKATMMKVSDPIIFGHGVRAYFKDVFAEHDLGNPNNGLGSILNDADDAAKAAIEQALRDGPALAMVDSDRGITNLHVPSDVIIDASMPAMIRSSGQMWNAAGEQQDTKAVIPDSSYAALYAETIAFCREHGAFDPATMGTTPNVGLMAQKAEEYGSHDKTFEIERAGTVRVLNQAGDVLLEHEVEPGDIWRACQTKDAPIRDWVRLAVERARATGAPAVFWLDETRAHDAQVLEKVREYLSEHDTDSLQIEILPVAEATRFTLERAARGEDTIAVTGNVLRDYLTDLFPILELGTSAKMLSIVPLMQGGGLFETGAGGSAPKHVQQLLKENHLRWDSLGEFLALAVSLEKAGAGELAQALDRATGMLLENGKSPSRKVGELDNRGSHFYLALYWAQELANDLAERLAADEEQIVGELAAVQGEGVDLGGYYYVDRDKADAVMRPSTTFNAALE